MADPLQVLSRFLFDQALRLDTSTATDPGDTPDWTVGTRLTALVRAVTDPTRALLQIGHHLVDAKLPVQVKAGDQLNLRVVEPHPRLVFALEDPPDIAAVSRVSLSHGARILADLLPRTPATPGQPLPLREALPLPEPAANLPHGEQIARTLGQNLRQSGLFYEHHLARWVGGEFPLAEVRKEPQNQPRPLPTGQAVIPPKPAAVTTERLPVDQIPPPTAQLKDALPRAPGEPVTPLPDTPLRGQVEMLEGRVLTVMLPSWFQRDFQWHLPQREPGDPDPGGEPTWSTHLKVDLPQLGEVSAHIRLSQQGLSLAVVAVDEERTRHLSEHQDELSAALEAAGLTVSHLSIGRANG